MVRTCMRWAPRAVRLAHAHRYVVPDWRAAHRSRRVRYCRVSAPRAYGVAGDHDPRPRAHEVAGRGSARRARSHAERIIGRYGAACRARARHRARSHDDHVRRALHLARSDFDRGDRGAHPHDQGGAVRHELRRVARCAGGRGDLRLHLRIVGRQGRGPRHAERACRERITLGAAVHAGIGRWARAVSLSRARLCGGPLGGTGPVTTWFVRLGRRALSFFERLGRGHLFLLQVLAGVPSVLLRPRLVIQQIYSVGVLSLIIILVSGLFVGMVLGLQGYNTLSDFGAAESLGVLVALSLVRELGPVVAALLFGGRAGSALTAEIGLMKATEQLSGMEMMAVDPLKRVIAPRFVAGTLAMPLLAAIFSAIGVMGGYFVGVGLLGVDDGAFWSQMQARVDLYKDVMNGVIKSAVFGFVASWIAVYEGYDAVPTSEGVSRATTRTVVHTALAVLGLDFVLTALMFGD